MLDLIKTQILHFIFFNVYVNTERASSLIYINLSSLNITTTIIQGVVVMYLSKCGSAYGLVPEISTTTRS